MSSERPDLVTEDHLLYLDDLRESGETNMYGAVPYLQRDFGLLQEDASTILSYWVTSLSERQEDESL